MVKHIHSTLGAALALALPFALVPATATAQEDPPPPLPQEQEVQEVCTAEFSPAEVDAGRAAVQVTARLSTDLGEVREIKAAEETGVKLASPEDLRTIALARGEPEEEEVPVPEPIEMSADATTATVWLNTEDAKAGTHEIVLKTAEGACTAHLTVKGLEYEEELPPPPMR